MNYATQVAADLNNKRIRSFIATWSFGYSGNPGSNLRDKKSISMGSLKLTIWFKCVLKVQTRDLRTKRSFRVWFKGKILCDSGYRRIFWRRCQNRIQQYTESKSFGLCVKWTGLESASFWSRSEISGKPGKYERNKEQPEFKTVKGFERR
jgi:hypothetical protein